MQDLKELATVVTGVLENRYTAGQGHKKLQELRMALEAIAMKESGCTQVMLNDSSKEETATVRLFYMTLSSLYSKVLIEAAQEQYYVKDFS